MVSLGILSNLLV